MFVFIVHRTVSYIFCTTIQAQRNRSERFKIISVYIEKAISSDRRYLRQIATGAFKLRTWDSDTRIGIISSATESKIIVWNLPFENQLFGYIHCCTEIPEINISMLPNTCNFHHTVYFFITSLGECAKCAF